MIRNILTLLLVIFVFSSYSQDCDCDKEFKFIVSLIESNSPSYFDQVSNSNQKLYEAHKKYYSDLSLTATSNRECISTIKRYLAFFKDEHLYLNLKPGAIPVRSATDTVAIKEFISNDPKFICNIDSLRDIRSGIEGVWKADDGYIEICICKNKTKYWDYVGIIVNENKTWWEKYQIKLEFSIASDGSITCVNYNGSRMPDVHKVTLNNDTLIIGRKYFVFIRDNENFHPNRMNEKPKLPEFEFKALSDQTLYFRISSFLYDAKPIIDSIVGNNLTMLKSYKNLVIDVRDNRGGNSPSLDTILPLLYTNPVKLNAIQDLASLDNIRYLEYLRDSIKEDKEYFDEISNTIDLMKNNIGKFITYEEEVYKSSTSYNNLENVAIICNSNCASTTEELLFFSKQSKKTKIYGENSHGAINYGSIRGHDFLCLPYKIFIAMNKTGFPIEWESDGVPVDVPLELNEESMWIDQVLKMIEN